MRKNTADVVFVQPLCQRCKKELSEKEIEKIMKREMLKDFRAFFNTETFKEIETFAKN